MLKKRITIQEPHAFTSKNICSLQLSNITKGYKTHRQIRMEDENKLWGWWHVAYLQNMDQSE